MENEISLENEIKMVNTLVWFVSDRRDILAFQILLKQ